ncbi:Retrovirus-related Pol polyprotein from transposon TNT 1-94 [Cardamine amara subsp. amara]|uniref:Retrovirus-related Pol polyprotein from transposon TNT 1-94 n=1 Tax=Cardamine amara subsp. amara TaxID=228776 RepID=A0ABD0Z2Z6_CARAN
MGDLVVSTGKPKEGGPSSIQCPMLNTTNYTVWAMRMKITLKVHKVWDIIETDSVEPDANEKNNMAIAWLFQSIPETLILQVGELDTSNKVWTAIKARHVGAERVKEARLQTLMSEFDRLKMKDTETIDEFVGKLSEILSKSAALETTMEEPKVVKKFLKSLPRKKYIHIVASLEQVLDLNTTSFEDIVGRLKAYEERILDEEEPQEDQNKLMYSNMESQVGYPNRDYNREYRGRGRGGRSFYRGRGRGSFNGERVFDLSKITCFRCDKTGHFASNCPDRLLKLQEAQENDNNETQGAYELMMHEVVYLNEKHCIPSDFETNAGEENIWYLDNGASNHMTGDRRYFDKIDDSVTGKVRFGDDSRVDIKGKGTVAFTDLNGEPQVMTDVYFIPDLKSNIISLGQATESGCDRRLKGEYLTMRDRDGKLLVKAERSKNRLYKVRMGLRNFECSYLTTISDSSRWHARLGHVSLANIKSMIDKELVQGAPNIVLEKEICRSCLLGKQTRKMFPQAATYRATKKLELVHGDLCGPISPNTNAGNRYVFVLIDDYSRYMWTILLKEKGDAFNKFKIFKTMVERESEARIQTFRTDRGGEFLSLEFNSFCEDSGIKRHLTAPYTPQQNGVVERRNRTLMEMARSILKHMHMPNYLWGEAIRHSTYLLNRVVTRALKEKTPYEMFRDKRPSIDHIRIFGCIAYAKAYRLLDPQVKKIVVSRDVIFDETKGWNWKNKDTTKDSDRTFRLTFDDFTEHGTQKKDENDETEQRIDDVDSSDEAENDSSPVTTHEQEQEEHETA